MKISIPPELTDPQARESDRIPHGEVMSIDTLTALMATRRVDWLSRHDGTWKFVGSQVVRCLDGSPPPAYDVLLVFKRPRTPIETHVQAEERAAFIAKKEDDYRKREQAQQGTFAEVLRSIKKP